MSQNSRLNAPEDSVPPEWQQTWHELWDILGCKWTFHIIRLLSMDGYGFNEMEREIHGITSTMLSRRLKQLHQEGIVSRTVESTTPPTTTYQLTETGEELAQVLLQIEQLTPVQDGEV